MQRHLTLLKGEPRSDARKPKNKTEELGQYLTPEKIAIKMVRSLKITSRQKKRLLDPCFGPGTFGHALEALNLTSELNIEAFEIDRDFAALFTPKRGRELNLRIQNFLFYTCKEKYDYAILNPPYVRQEWIKEKSNLREHFRQTLAIDIPGTANLYVYFVVKVIQELKEGGRFSCIIYDSWQSTKYGEWLKQYLIANCSGLKVEQVSELPFDGLLIDAAIISGTRSLHKDLLSPFCTENIDSFTSKLHGMKPVGEIFNTKRGLRLKQSDFFITDMGFAAEHGATPFIKKVSLVKGYCVPRNHKEAALIINDTAGNSNTFKELKRRLQFAKKNPSQNVSILNWFDQRPDSWYYHSTSEIAQLIFNYYLRNRPKFILNGQRQYSDNFYGLTPITPGDCHAWLASLNSTFSIIGLVEQARNQGAGLAKLQLFEFRRARVTDITNWNKKDTQTLSQLGRELISKPNDSTEIIKRIDNHIGEVLGTKASTIKSLPKLLQAAENRARNLK